MAISRPPHVAKESACQSIEFRGFSRTIWHGEAVRGDARSQDHNPVPGQGRAGAHLCQPPAAPLLPGGGQGQAREPGEPVRAVGRGDRGGPRGARRRPSGAGRVRRGRRGGGRGRRAGRVGARAVPPARARGRGARAGAQAGVSRAARRAVSDAGRGVRAADRPGGAPRVEAGHPPLVGRHHAGRRPGHRRRLPGRGVRRAGLAGRQQEIETRLAARHLRDGGLALFDLSSSWVTGRRCPLAAYGYSRDARRDHPQITYGLLTDPAGRPVAVRVFPGNTADPTAFAEIPGLLRETFGLSEVVVVGDRGMLTTARIDALKALGGFGWVTALRAPQIAALAAEDGPLQLSLFDEQNLAEITHPDYPGERLIACRNPALADERARKRAALLAATEAELAKVAAAVQAGRLADPAKIGIRVARVAGKHKMAKHFRLDIAPGRFAFARDTEAIDAEAALDGLYLLRTTVPAETLDTAAVVRAYKNLVHVERDFRSLKTIDVELRPIHHHTETRVRAHVLLCMLAGYLTWHLRAALAPLTFTDETPPHRPDPVAPAHRSPAAATKAATKRTADGGEARGFRDLLDHLGTLTRNTVAVTVAGHTTRFEQLTVPTPTQQRAFDLLGAPVPLSLT